VGNGPLEEYLSQATRLCRSEATQCEDF
jgi:hypothetical protein